jgi:hypothetical protein
MKVLRLAGLIAVLVGLFAAPVAAQGPPGSWTTDMTFLNLEGSEATLEIMSYAECEAPCTADAGTVVTSTTVAANGSFYYNPANDASFPTGFSGSVVASSDRNMAATVTVGNTEAGTAYASDAYAGVLETSDSVFLPIVMGKLSGVWNTMMVIQNAGDANATITIHYIGAGAPEDTTVTNLPPNMMAIVDQQTNAAMTNFNGSALVTSNQPLAIVVEEYKSSGGVLVDYVGVPSTKAAMTVYMPGYIALGVWATDFTVVNTTGTAATVNVAFAGVTNTLSFPIAANGSAYVNGTANYYPDGATGTAPTGTYYGAATVTADQNIVIVYNMANSGPGGPANLNLGYVAPTAADGSTKAAMPLVMNKAYGGGWDSTYSVQVIGGGAATLQFAYSGVGTQPASETINGSKTFNFGVDNHVPAGYAGGVVLTSDVPILIVGDQAGPYTGDSSAGFPGVPMTP